MESLYKNIHQDVIDRCKAEERDAQFQLYKLYYKSMYNTSLRIVGNEAEAEDIMQEAFLNAFRKIKTYSGQVSFGAWLKRIVVNRSLDHLKKRKVQLEELDERITGEMVENPLMEIKEVDVQKIKQAIFQLPDGYRVVLSLYLLEGYDHDEISEILNISSSSSRSQLLRAKRKLRDYIKKDEVFSIN
ncbi:RNA polymerase sigma factor [Sunxiuqinia indica]|uniref:RNA polymerase sigma factor n=1 Tax=Sunxiuqinia indica TaxID=2692584 RepID=UPI0019154678|nr:RNA polymerase sigma factor [Sunxiuqinia indica]